MCHIHFRLYIFDNQHQCEDDTRKRLLHHQHITILLKCGVTFSLNCCPVLLHVACCSCLGFGQKFISKRFFIVFFFNFFVWKRGRERERVNSSLKSMKQTTTQNKINKHLLFELQRNAIFTIIDLFHLSINFCFFFQKPNVQNKDWNRPQKFIVKRNEMTEWINSNKFIMRVVKNTQKGGMVLLQNNWSSKYNSYCHQCFRHAYE